MIDLVVGAIVVAIVGSSLSYIIKAKKNGVKCIGCPDAQTCCSGGSAGDAIHSCKGGCGSCTGCGCHTDAE